jgi:hypothetical protein
MGKDQSQVGSTVDTKHTEPEEIRREIQRTRVELGETVEALAAKTDVKGQAKQKVAEAKRNASVKKAREHPLPVAVAGGFVVGFVTARLTGGR